MQLKIYKDHHNLSEAAATELIELVKNKPDAVVCLASGDTPRLTCKLFVEKAIAGKADLSQITFIGLDEWVGIPPGNDGSCHYFFQHEIIEPLHFSIDQVHLFDAMSGDLDEECRKMDNTIFKSGGIDCMVVGIGMNGHIGFNEPGVAWDLKSHAINLDENTRRVGQKYFSEKTTLDKGITLGLQHLIESKEAILIANGKKKAEIVQLAIESPAQTQVPASIMQTHPNGWIMIDDEAASLLKKNSSSSFFQNSSGQ